MFIRCSSAQAPSMAQHGEGEGEVAGGRLPECRGGARSNAGGAGAVAARVPNRRAVVLVKRQGGPVATW